MESELRESSFVRDLVMIEWRDATHFIRHVGHLVLVEGRFLPYTQRESLSSRPIVSGLFQRTTKNLMCTCSVICPAKDSTPLTFITQWADA